MKRLELIIDSSVGRQRYFVRSDQYGEFLSRDREAAHRGSVIDVEERPMQIYIMVAAGSFEPFSKEKYILGPDSRCARGVLDVEAH